ncbi:glycosyltransferase [Aquimarina sp. U1-2]|uniref:glycosyltransferase n=1 Tax=Aquimarina sp. U1-2 TaxID=2823141 RepID=UPI001AECFFEF|nr:glycosyltransferase [Aquimarina sp. U1-2]MBP2833265.1 glycosyltransferase [Aquimarina sp. U1-2]
MEDKVIILASTVDRKILENDHLIGLHLSPDLSMVIVNQMINDKTPLQLEKEFCKIVNDNGKGLSRSRNIALDQVNSGYCIVADDDVEYVKEFDTIIKESFNKNQEDEILTFMIKTPDGKFFKEYANKQFVHSKRTLLKVSSIDMVLNLNRIQKSLRFDENFGLGAQFNTGENNIFLFDAHKQGCKISFIPETIVIHPYENSGRVLDKKHFVSKGAVFKRMFGFKGFLVSMVFCLKKRKEAKLQKIGLFNTMIYSLRGYLKYKK